jgi:hypothetical protein
MRQDTGKTLEVFRLELLHRASAYGDLQAWTAFQQGLEKIVLTWFHDHPCSEAARRLYNESHFVALSFERLQQAVVQGQAACKTLSEVLVYLHASLNGAILETLRVSERPGTVSFPWPDEESCTARSEFWDRLRARHSNQREQRLAYLLFHCGLEPAEIVHLCPQEWNDIHEVTRLRRIILERLLSSNYT